MELKERLRLVEIDFEVKNVRVLFLRDYKMLPTPQGVINVKKGDEIPIPRWQARLLESQGYVNVRDAEIDVDYINAYHFKEKRRTGANQLSPLPQDFYMKSKDLVKKLDDMIRESPSHMLLREREVVEKNLIEIGETRLIKIMRLAQTGGGEELRDKMTPEESLVYDNVKNVVDSWRDYIKRLFPESERGADY